MRDRRFLLAGAVTLLATIGPSDAAKAEEAEAISVDYAALSECPSAASFVREISARSPRFRFAEEGAMARTLVVRIVRKGTHVEGTLTLREADGAETGRAVDGASCGEVVAGLALIAAVAVQSSAPGAPSDPSPAVVESPNNPANGPEPAAPREARDTARAKVRVSTAEATRARTWELSLGAEGEVISGVAPSLLGSVPVFVELSAARRRSVFSPAVRLRFERPGDEDPSGNAHFTWTEGSVDVCPVAWWAGEALRLQPCVRAEAGALRATGANVQPTRSSTRPWLSLGAAGTARWYVLRPVFVEVEAALIAPLVRDRFFFEPNTTVFRPGALAFGGSVGAGVSIW